MQPASSVLMNQLACIPSLKTAGQRINALYDPKQSVSNVLVPVQ
jgi:hypothetical protein